MSETGVKALKPLCPGSEGTAFSLVDSLSLPAFTFPSCVFSWPSSFPSCVFSLPSSFPSCVFSLPSSFPSCVFSLPSSFPSCVFSLPSSFPSFVRSHFGSFLFLCVLVPCLFLSFFTYLLISITFSHIVNDFTFIFLYRFIRDIFCLVSIAISERCCGFVLWLAGIRVSVNGHPVPLPVDKQNCGEVLLNLLRCQLTY